jgi:hypothetical protein
LEIRPYSPRVIVLPEAVVGSSVTTNVLPEDLDVARVWTFTLSNSVIRVLGISSVNLRSSSALGLSWIFFAWTVTLAIPPSCPEGARCRGSELQSLEFYPDRPKQIGQGG